jgi:hypothetical protein
VNSTSPDDHFDSLIALDARKIVWATQAGPGGIFGGIDWDSSVGDGRVYIAEANTGTQHEIYVR